MVKESCNVFRECLDKAEVLDTQDLIVSKGFLEQLNDWLKTLVTGEEA